MMVCLQTQQSRNVVLDHLVHWKKSHSTSHQEIEISTIKIIKMVNVESHQKN